MAAINDQGKNAPENTMFWRELKTMLNPHFDQNRIIWSDDYSGQYEPPVYNEQFDLQWKIALEGDQEYYNNPGTSVDDGYIEDRVYEWTGKHPTNGTGFHDGTMGSRVLDNPLDPDHIKGKKCIDIGCGMGRWTRTMQYLGAKDILSVDVSESALKSTARFNPNILEANIMELPKEHPELKEQFDFGNLWGVAMCTHDPQKAFKSAAFTIKPGGALYLMVYAPDGIHNTRLTNARRKKFNDLNTVEERLALVDTVHARKWDWDYPLIDNILNVTRNLRRLPKGSKIGFLDMLEPFYNWTIPLDVIEGWMKDNGFGRMIVLNEGEKGKMRCAHHVLGIKDT